MKSIFIAFNALILSLAFCVGTVVLPGCSTTTGNPQTDARNAAVNTALVDGGKILGNVAANVLFNVAKQEATDGKADWQSAATAGLYAGVDFSTVSGAVSDVIKAYSGGNAPATAAAAQAVFDTATSGQSKAAVVNAIAGVINSAVAAGSSASNP